MARSDSLFGWLFLLALLFLAWRVGAVGAFPLVSAVDPGTHAGDTPIAPVAADAARNPDYSAFLQRARYFDRLYGPDTGGRVYELAGPGGMTVPLKQQDTWIKSPDGELFGVNTATWRRNLPL